MADQAYQDNTIFFLAEDNEDNQSAEENSALPGVDTLEDAEETTKQVKIQVSPRRNDVMFLILISVLIAVAISFVYIRRRKKKAKDKS